MIEELKMKPCPNGCSYSCYCCYTCGQTVDEHAPDCPDDPSKHKDGYVLTPKGIALVVAAVALTKRRGNDMWNVALNCFNANPNMADRWVKWCAANSLNTDDPKAEDWICDAIENAGW